MTSIGELISSSYAFAQDRGHAAQSSHDYA
jgi:hypothetical protein